VRLSWRLTIPCLALLAFGCLSDVAVATSSSHVDPGLKACNVLAQDCGAPDLRCKPSNRDSSVGTCEQKGAMGQPGGDCLDDPSGMGPQCGRGLVCVRRDPNDPHGKCFALCDPDHACPVPAMCRPPPGSNPGAWGVCLDASMQPAPPCNGVAQDCGGPTQACVVRPGAPNQCMMEGTGQAGSPCVAAADCVKGYQCATRVQQGSAPPAFVEIVDGTVQDGRCMTLCGRVDPVQCQVFESCVALRDPDGTERTDVGVCIPRMP